MEALTNQPNNEAPLTAIDGMQQGEFSTVDYLNHLADEWRAQGYTEDEIQQGILAEESRIDNLYYNLDES